MENNKFYFVTVECFAPMSGTIPVEAASPEEAEQKILAELAGTGVQPGAKDIKVLNIEEVPQPPTTQTETIN